MKKYFLLLVIMCFTLSDNTVEAQTMHIFLVADTYDDLIGESCYKDFESMKVQAGLMAQYSGLGKQYYPFKSGDFTKQNLLANLSYFECKPNDVIFFYYAGHGARNNLSKWPSLLIDKSTITAQKNRANLVPLASIDSILSEKGARFRVLIADCCNNAIDDTGGQPISRSFMPVSPDVSKVKDVKVIRQFYHSLFQDVSGSLLVSSSSPNEKASCYKTSGGIFTNSLSQVFTLNSEKHEKTSWDKLLSIAKSMTFIMSSEKQTPIWEFKQSNGQLVALPQSVEEELEAAHFTKKLLAVADRRRSSDSRFDLMSRTLNNVFESPEQSVVEVYGKNGRTMVHIENAQNFVERLFSSSGLVELVELGVETHEQSGKITKLKIHEVYEQQ